MNTRWALLLLLGCLGKKHADLGTNVRWVAWMETEAGVEPLPPSALKKIKQALWKRKIRGTPTGDRVHIASLEPDERVTGDSPIVIIACEPLFDGIANMHYRWRVQCELTVAEAAQRFDRTARASFEMVFPDEREAVAMERIAPEVGRQLGEALDDWLATR